MPQGRSAADGGCHSRERITGGQAINGGDQARRRVEIAESCAGVVGEVARVRRDRQRFRGDGQAHRSAANAAACEYPRAELDAGDTGGEGVGVVGIRSARAGHVVHLLARHGGGAWSRARDRV